MVSVSGRTVELSPSGDVISWFDFTGRRGVAMSMIIAVITGLSEEGTLLSLVTLQSISLQPFQQLFLPTLCKFHLIGGRRTL